MKVPITEYLHIDLETEQWECRRCEYVIGPARSNYKEGLLVYDRDPREIHKPLLDPTVYRFTFAPHPEWCRILEYYCPGCGTMVETEYTVPGHPPLRDLELDVDALKAQWKNRMPSPGSPDLPSPFEKGGPRGISSNDSVSKSPLAPLFQTGGPKARRGSTVSEGEGS